VIAPRFDYGILGPLEVLRDGEPLAIRGPRQRAALALLLLNANRTVSRDRLVGELDYEQTDLAAAPRPRRRR
jgi:DNA-binding SARP family transcriptional activator